MDSHHEAHEREVEPGGQRTESEAPKCVVIPAVARPAESPVARSAILARAMRRLKSGELDREVAITATARRLLGLGFFSA